MRPGTVWTASVLLALGICGVLDAAGVVPSSQTIGQWWPVAIIAWAALETLAARRLTLGAVICAAIGLGLLADVQAWAADALLWSLLAIAIGLAVLVDASLDRSERRSGDAPTTLPEGAS